MDDASRPAELRCSFPNAGANICAISLMNEGLACFPNTLHCTVAGHEFVANASLDGIKSAGN